MFGQLGPSDLTEPKFPGTAFRPSRGVPRPSLSASNGQEQRPATIRARAKEIPAIPRRT